MLSAIAVVLILVLAFTTHFLLTGNTIFSQENLPPNVVVYVNNDHIYTMEKVELTAKFTDEDGNVVKWEWDFDGDGNYEQELSSYESVYGEYAEDGVYYPSLRVTDDKGDFANDSVKITVLNRLPDANIQISSVKEFTNNDILFEVLGTDPDGYIVEYRWDFEGDGIVDFSTLDTSVTHRYADNGVYYAELLVVDNDGGENSSTITISIDNRAPIININMKKKTVATNELLAFAADVTDPDGEVILYEWDFTNDGVVDSSSKISADAVFSFGDDGNYTVILRVMDDDYTTAESSVVITVNNVEPVAIASVSEETVSTLVDVIFQCRGSDSDGTIVKFEWDFNGDGVYDWESTSLKDNFTYSYDDNGVYHAVLRVTDDDGAISTDVKEITVNNRAPTAKILMDETRETTDVEIIFDGNGTDADGDILKYEWDFTGDGNYDFSSLSSPLTTYIYGKVGTFVARLRVTDDDDDTDVVSVTMTIDENRPPIAHAGGDGKSNKGETIMLDGSGSTDPDGHSLMYQWNFGDGVFADGKLSSHLYIDSGTFTVTLTVTDEGGLQDTDSCLITVLGGKYAVVVGIADYP
ncbi:MAG: PKD domain-containing protein, partial [Candidatus Thermoplasmatota archaeon]|nr:PKD domain-containing protein [Candidatus Thermoplasmatota archaeon]